MFLIVGLGNPGKKYHFNRHNIGFLALDIFAKQFQSDSHWKKESDCELLKFKIDNEQVLLLKPQTYMNLSGGPVQRLLNFYKINIKDMLVVQDELELGFGKVKFHFDRGHAGHNGIRDISEKLGTSAYARLKLGVGRPTNPQMSVADYLLQNFSDEEMNQLEKYLGASGDLIESFIFEGLSQVSTKFNGKSLI